MNRIAVWSDGTPVTDEQQRLSSALQRLKEAHDEALNECADAVHAEAYPHAERFIRALPSWSLDELEIDFELDGMFSFEWRSDRQNAFSVSVDHKGQLHWAIYTETLVDHGRIDDFVSMPQVILDNIKSIEDL